MRVAVLGGDGFVGWPTTLHLSNLGHEVAVVDNLSRRWIDTELGVQSLTPMDSIQERQRIWKEVTGRSLLFEHIDVADEYPRFKDWLATWRPEAVIHFAEQRAAPYSMKSDRHKTYTVNNNVNATHNLLNALVATETDAHVVHLGTMGVYGYSTAGASIPEGYLTVDVTLDDGGKTVREILYPTDAGSIYHMTKCLDQVLFQFYAKNDGVRITDLHQGIVWGTHTDQTRRHEQLINRFDYDGDYGTVLNRFLIQAALHHPLTVHGTGGQSRAFIHIQDSVRCIAIALANPPRRGERTKIFNQMTEVHRVRDLAKLVSKRGHRQPAQSAQGGCRKRAVREERPVRGPRPGSDQAADRAAHRTGRRGRQVHPPRRPVAHSEHFGLDPGDRREAGHRDRSQRRTGRRLTPLGTRTQKQRVRLRDPGHERRLPGRRAGVGTVVARGRQ
ncbi:MAG: NAD-dependent epimerase/dehydratase family protein [Rhodospirillales bacterium]|nr:NAD-dependent epimerase/dehydratase family protein [Rhodospirillales bacterium]